MGPQEKSGFAVVRTLRLNYFFETFFRLAGSCFAIRSLRRRWRLWSRGHWITGDGGSTHDGLLVTCGPGIAWTRWRFLSGRAAGAHAVK